MKRHFGYSDFGFPDSRTFDLAMTCGPILRFEIRKHNSDVKYATVRLEAARTVLASETEIAMEETSMTRFIERWVEMHEKHLVACKAKLAFLREVIAADR